MLGVRSEPQGGTLPRLRYFAWRWYRIPADAADDIAQDAQLTYVEVRSRYEGEGDREDLLLGIFRNKCREWFALRARRGRARKAMRDAALTGEAPVPVLPDVPTQQSVLDDMVEREDGRLILEALAALRPKARKMFELIREGVTRSELIRRFGVNKNTLDSRLHTYRGELRTALEQRGVHI